MQILPDTNKEFFKLAALQSIFIFSLIPNARIIESNFKSVYENVPEILKIFLLFLFIAIIAKFLINIIRFPQKCLWLCFVIATVCGSFLLNPLVVEISHLLLYGPLCFFFCCALHNKDYSKTSILKAVFYSQLVSLSDEALQAMHPARFFDLRDLFFNLIGTFIGLYCFKIRQIHNLTQLS